MFAVDTNRQRKRLAKYILAKLEEDASQRACDSDTIEHILPENPANDWDSFPEQYWEAAVYRLGNLTLLEASTNRRVGNGDFPAKLDEYRRSGYLANPRLAVGARGLPNGFQRTCDRFYRFSRRWKARGCSARAAGCGLSQPSQLQPDDVRAVLRNRAAHPAGQRQGNASSAAATLHRAALGINAHTA